jgi:hypothetical protein
MNLLLTGAPWVSPCDTLHLLCAVVVKSSLAPFDCSERGGLRTMDAEPSIVCNGTGPHGRMRVAAALTLVVFAVGVPAAIAAFLLQNYSRVQFDQRLREKGEGDTSLTNPNIQVRTVPCVSITTVCTWWVVGLADC